MNLKANTFLLGALLVANAPSFGAQPDPTTLEPAVKTSAAPAAPAAAAPKPAAPRSWLGVRTERTARPAGNGQGGLVLLSVAQASPAERAGLAAGDVLVAIADQRTLEQRDIKRALSDWQVGDVVPIQILRAGQALQRSIQVEAMPSALRVMRRA